MPAPNNSNGMTILPTAAAVPIWRAYTWYDTGETRNDFGLEVMPSTAEPLTWPEATDWLWPNLVINSHGVRTLLIANWTSGDPWRGFLYQRQDAGGWTAPARVRFLTDVPSLSLWRAAVCMNAPTDNALAVGWYAGSALYSFPLVWRDGEFRADAEHSTALTPGGTLDQIRPALAQALDRFVLVYGVNDGALQLQTTDALAAAWSGPQALNVTGYFPVLIPLLPTSSVLLLYHDGAQTWHSRVLTRNGGSYEAGTESTVAADGSFEGGCGYRRADGTCLFYYREKQPNWWDPSPILSKISNAAGDGWH